MRISSTSSPEERRAARSDDPEELDGLSRDESYRVRVLVAANESTSPEALTRLGYDKDTEVRRAVLYNSSTPSLVFLRTVQHGVPHLVSVALGEILRRSSDLREDLAPVRADVVEAALRGDANLLLPLMHDPDAMPQEDLLTALDSFVSSLPQGDAVRALLPGWAGTMGSLIDASESL